MAGLRQAELAQAVGISASYLNLIEHNKRRIGGKLLLDIAAHLDVEPSMLSQGAEAALIEALSKAASDAKKSGAESAQVDEFAGRFPGWAELIAAQHQRVLQLEAMVETLTDRLSHDPQLAGSMHDVLSMVTAVRSTASILFENKELEPEWRARFHRNLDEDSRRLAESSQSLVKFLDNSATAEARLSLPQDEMDAFLKSNHYHFPVLEQGGSVETVLSDASALQSDTAKQLTLRMLEQYSEDARIMPLLAFQNAFDTLGGDFSLLARRFKVSLAAVLRRAALLPADLISEQMGLVSCDNAGTLLLRKELPGFSLPRFGGASPNWPLFRALSRPMQPIRDVVDFAGRYTEQFECIAVSEPDGTPELGRDVLFASYMLILPRGVSFGQSPSNVSAESAR